MHKTDLGGTQEIDHATESFNVQGRALWFVDVETEFIFHT